MSSAEVAAETGDRVLAGELYLECLERCSGTVFVEELARHVRTVPRLEAQLWEVVERMEERIVLADASTQEFRDYSERLVQVYAEWGQEERMRRQLAKLLEMSSPKAYGAFLMIGASLFPVALTQLSPLDVELLIEDVESAPGRDRVIAELHRLMPNGSVRAQESLELSAASRIRTALQYARLLRSAGRGADAVRAIRASIAGTSCDQVLATLGAERELVDIAMQLCPERSIGARNGDPGAASNEE